MTTPNRRGGEPPQSLGGVFAGLPAPWNGEWILKPPVDEANEVDLTAGPGMGSTAGSRPNGVNGVTSITTDRISGLNYRNRDVISALLGDTIPILSSWQVLSDALFNGLLSGFTSIENFIETIFKLVTGEEVDLSFLSDTARTILESFQTVITPIVEFIQWVWDNIGQDVLQAVLDLLAWVWAEFETLTGGNADDALRTVFTFLAWLFSEFGDSVESVLKPIFSTLKSLWVNVGQDSLDAVIDLISDLTQDLSLDLLGTLQRLAEFFQAIPDIQEWFDGIPGLDSIVEAVTQLPGGIDQLKRWAEQVPTIDQLVSKLTGTANATDLTQVGIWAKTLLDKTSSIPAANLVGTLPAAALGTIPVSAINISTPNLLSQGAFSAEKSVTGGNGWSWDAGVNRTGDGGSARVDCNGSVQELFSNQTVNATSDDRIELGAFIKTSSNFPSNGVIKVSVIKFNGSSPAGSSVANATVDLMTKTGGSTGWYELDSGQPWSVPEGVTSVRVRLSVQASAGSVWFDDVTLIKSGLLQQNLVEYLLDGWSGMWDAAFGSNGTFGKNIFDAVNAIGAISNRALLAANNATSSLNQILAMLSGSGKANAFDFGLALKNNIDGFTGFLNSLGKGDFAAAGAAVQTAVNDFGSFLYNAGQGTAATIGGLVNGAISGATQAVNDIGSIINNIGETITGGIVTTAQHVGQAINGAIQGTVDTWNNFWSGVFGTTPPGRSATHVLNAASKLKVDTGKAQTTADNARGDNVLTNIAIYKGFYGSGGSGTVAETQSTIAAIKTEIFKGYTLESLTYDSGNSGWARWIRPWENPKVAALLHGEGANNSTTITDNSPQAANWTVSGSARVSTAQKKFGSSSILIDGGANSRLNSPSSISSLLAFELDDFCIEMWVRLNSSGAVLWDARNPAVYPSYAPVLYVDGSDQKLKYFVGTGVQITGSTALALNRWYHVAVSRAGNQTRLWLDGLQQGDMWIDETDYATNSVVRIGQDQYGSGSANFYIDDLRVTKSKARYTVSNFSVPTEQFSDEIEPKNAPKEFFACGWGSGGGGQVGQKVVDISSAGGASGGNGGAPGGFIAVELDPDLVPATVKYKIAAGGLPNSLRTVNIATGQPNYSPGSLPSETNFGSYFTTKVGEYTVVDLLGYYTTNLSAPGSGGAGGVAYRTIDATTYRGYYGSNGGSSPLAAGGAGGIGSMWRSDSNGPYYQPQKGGDGVDAVLTGKSRAGGGGGGGGGGSWARYQSGWWNAYNSPGALGGNGGRPGGGGGGGGGAYTYDYYGIGFQNMGTPAGIDAGNGGYGGHGMIVLLWR